MNISPRYDVLPAEQEIVLQAIAYDLNGGTASSPDVQQNPTRPTVSNRTLTVSPGDNLQAVITNLSNAGGGVLNMNPGTYDLAYLLSIPSYITIEGNGAIIDFGAGAFQIQIVGSDSYSTGTVAISNDGTAVVGSGTTWTADMVGRSILLEDFWYVIATRTDNTHITIDRAYMGTTLSGASYVIATTVNTIAIRNLYVQNTSIAAIKYQYVNGLTLDGVITSDALTGVDGDDSSFINILNAGADLCGTGMTFDNVQFGTWFNNNITQCSTAGVTWNTCRNWCIDVFAFVNIGGNAMTFTNCQNNDILDFSLQHITGKGIEFVSGCSDMGATAGVIKDCTSDGIKLTGTTDQCSFSNLQIHDNGGYGINIANANCDNNILTGNFAATNSSGNLNDSGTGTVKTGNSGF